MLVNVPSTNSELRSGASQFRDQLLDCMPQLRAFARSLCRDRDEADDLTQEALLKAWQSRQSFAPGTNFKAWAFTILRNHFYSNRRRAWRSVRWDQDTAELIPAASDAAVWAAELSDLFRALMSLNEEQREAVMLVGAGQYSYCDAAQMCSCAIGTTKSRVARARQNLLSAMEGKRKVSNVSRPAPGRATRDIMALFDRVKVRRASSAELRRSGPH